MDVRKLDLARGVNGIRLVRSRRTMLVQPGCMDSEGPKLCSDHADAQADLSLLTV